MTIIGKPLLLCTRCRRAYAVFGLLCHYCYFQRIR